MSIASERLEDLLLTLQDRCMNRELALRAVGRNEEVHAIIANWRKLRARLLNPASIVDDSEFVMPHGAIRENPELAQLGNVPWELHHWTHYSRRIYAVDAALQKQFLNTDYSGLNWDQIHFPFGSFVIELETPLIETEVETPVPCDAFMVTRVDVPSPENTPNLQVRLRMLAQNNMSGEYRDFERKWISSDLERGRLHLALRRKRDIDKKFVGPRILQGVPSASIYAERELGPEVRIEAHDIYNLMFRIGMRMGQPVYREREWRTLSQSAKVTVGLCLYIEHVAKSTVNEERLQMPKNPSQVSAPLPITDEAFLCRVLHEGTLNVQAIQKKLKRRSAESGKPQGPQARTAHWKRPRGKGNDPNWPKTVRIEDYRTHRELLEDGGVVGGTRTEVTSAQ